MLSLFFKEAFDSKLWPKSIHQQEKKRFILTKVHTIVTVSNTYCSQLKSS